ncbi:H(+)/Cl(-) exchange transporter ClcA [Luteolibacter sp. SL250]|uniref:H(+)/Cl(-) exchange transporter ClcA n=1 Tax=Luteolibacter sp. SL250 TaxID=2995170 RepID=UPI002271958E|nr:H(+)/Cl(-) exchange transporter ClcA [Luteolibacter sp. SL250]WAC17879.1 H(+)/Cl(-) exchange transporter ClcA [Luteolibacter sp. SL250]
MNGAFCRGQDPVVELHGGDAGGGLNEPEVKRRHILPKAVAVGITAGVVASAFRLGLEEVEHLREVLIARLPRGPALMAAVAGGAFLGGLGLWLVRRFAPEAAGSGIPHLQSVLLGEKPMRWKRVLPVKFIAGLLSIGGGMALGREGPTVQMGGAVGMMVAGWFRIRTGFGEKKALMSAGAGAGLAAAFNAPLAGVIFVLEELQRSFTPVVFVAAFLASVCGDVVSRLLAGDSPIFHLGSLPEIPLRELPLALLLGVLAGFAGILFNRSLVGTLSGFERLTKSDWVPGALAGGLCGLAAWSMPGLAGGGGSIADQAISGGIALSLLPVLLVARFALTMVSYGSGAAGGIFAPMLVMGALGGLLMGQSIESIFPAALGHPEVFSVLGMGALFTAVVRAPLTGVVLMVEMTGHYGFMLPLLVCCLTAYGVAERLGEPPIYESLRRRGKTTD